MGIIDSKSNNQYNQLLKKYKIVKTIDEKHITYLEDLDEKGEDCLCREIKEGDKRVFELKINEVKEKQEILNNNHVVNIKQFIVSQNDHFCGAHLALYVLFQYPHRTLNQEVVERASVKSRFSEKELWSIIASCILGMSHLQKNNIPHQSITSDAILVNNNGVIKVADPYCTQQEPNYQKIITKTKIHHIYLSPQLCKCLDNAEVVPTQDINPYKSDVFSFGMVIMETALLKYLDDCYREQCTKINYQTVTYYLDQIGQLYNLQLKQMIEKLLTFDISKRPDWQELKHYMKDDKQISTVSERANQSQSQLQPHLQQYPHSNTHSAVNTLPHLVNDHHNFHHLGGQQTRPVSYYAASQTSTKLPEVVGVTRPEVVVNPQFQAYQTFNQPVVGGSSFGNTSPSQPVFGEIVPIKPCNINLIRPALGTRPADSYITHTKIDQNLVQVSDDEDQLQTNESQHARTNQNNYNTYQPPQPHHTFVNHNQRTFLPSQQIQSGMGYKQHIQSNFHPSGITSTSTYSSTPIPIHGSQFNSPTVNVRYVHQPIQNVGLPHHNSTFNRPISMVTSPASNFKQIDTSNLFTDYEKLGIKKSNPTILSPTTQSVNYSKVDIPSQNRPVSMYRQNKVNVVPSQNIPIQNKKFVVQTFDQGSRYEGQKLNGLRHGKGKFYYQDGGLYDGDWKQNKMCGKGKLFYQSGKIAYDGDWQNDQFTGYGILYNQNTQQLDEPYHYNDFRDMEQVWTKFQGYFVNDLKQGKGKLHFVNGQYYDGQFKQDVIDGQGVFHTMDGEAVRGIWDNNILVKTFK